MNHLENLSHEELIRLIEVYALSWLAHDGCWFLSAESNHGLEQAIKLDKESWEKFSPVEARRLMKFLKLEEGCGLAGLEKVLKLRMYSVINKQNIERQDEDTLIFKMEECRVQKTRQDKNMLPFPCKSVGFVEFKGIAKTVDKRIEVECISCPPDEIKDYYCGWKFSLKTK